MVYIMIRKNLLKKTISVVVAAGLFLSAIPVFAAGPNGYQVQPNMFGQQNMSAPQNSMFGQMQFNWNAFGLQQQNSIPVNNGQMNNITGINTQATGNIPGQTALSFNGLKLVAEKLDIDTEDMTDG
jgi:hypothetical protein